MKQLLKLNMRKNLTILVLACMFALSANAQIKLDGILGQVNDLLSNKELLKVKKGFSPKFSLGNLKLNKVGILGEQLKGINVLGKILNKKSAEDINKLYKTYKTGLVVYKVLASAGTVATAYSAVRGIAGTDKFDDKTVRKLITPAISSLVTGVVTKLLTKKASYKAVDLFNGVVKKKVKDIFSIGAASQLVGVGLYVKL
jgi:hypothetical protein